MVKKSKFWEKAHGCATIVWKIPLEVSVSDYEKLKPNVHKKNVGLLLWLELFVKRAVSVASTEVCTFKLLGAECVPASGTEDFAFVNVVH